MGTDAAGRNVGGSPALFHALQAVHGVNKLAESAVVVTVETETDADKVEVVLVFDFFGRGRNHGHGSAADDVGEIFI